MKINGKRALKVALPVLGVIFVVSGIKACTDSQINYEKNDKCAILVKNPKPVFEFLNTEERDNAIREYETEYYMNAIITGNHEAFTEGKSPIKSVNCLDYKKNEKVKAKTLLIQKIK